MVITILYIFPPPPPPPPFQAYMLISTVIAFRGWGIAQGHNHYEYQVTTCSRTSLTHSKLATNWLQPLTTCMYVLQLA